MQCSACGQDNPEGMKFCGECGAPFKHQCLQCGFENPPRFKFCGECGAPFAQQAEVRLKSKGHPPIPHPQPPATYTPPHLAERILAEQAAMEARGATDGERKTIILRP